MHNLSAGQNVKPDLVIVVPFHEEHSVIVSIESFFIMLNKIKLQIACIQNEKVTDSQKGKEKAFEYNQTIDLAVDNFLAEVILCY